MNFTLLSFGELFNSIPKESTIKKGMLKKFGINGISISKISQSQYGMSPLRWKNPVMNSVEEVILVQDFLTPRDSMIYVRKLEEDFNTIRHGRVDWKGLLLRRRLGGIF